MREIKFRAWDTDPDGEVSENKNYMFYQSRTYGGGEYLADFDCEFDEETGCAYSSGYVFAHSINFADWDFAKKEMENKYRHKDKHPDRFILMQYTGLKDKNGKEIYEGDVVEYMNRADRLCGDIVCWNTKNLRWGTKNRGYPLACLDIEYEVIGNTYENPNLLEDRERELRM